MQTLATRGLEEPCFQLCCCVSVLFWREILQYPVQLSPVKTGGYPSDRGIYPMDHRNKTSFMHLYYSYSRLLQEAWGSHFSPLFLKLLDTTPLCL
jgi:hypothetical protein